MFVGYGPYPSSVEVELWLYCLIGSCKVERGVWYSYSGLEILHGGEGGDAELGARTSKRIFAFAFDPLSLELFLSFILCKASSISTFHIISFSCICTLHIFILLIHIICSVVCVPHLYLTNKSFT